MFKTFTKRLAFFSIPIFIGVLYLFARPVDRAFAYHYVEQNCANHGAWLHDRIFENTNPVDIAFIGSSRSIHGIMDQLITDSLPQKQVANLSYCWLGRNLSYTILKDVLKEKSPEILVLEVREDEDRYSHTIFPYLAEQHEILSPPLLFNRDILSDFWAALQTRYDYHKQGILGIRPSIYPINQNLYGYGPSDMQADTALLNSQKNYRIKRAARAAKGFSRWFYMQYPRSYIEKITDLATANNIQLYFLYIPEYGSLHEAPSELETYQTYSSVWIPPASIFEYPPHWMDDGHLNDRGAMALSKWVVGKLKDVINK